MGSASGPVCKDSFGSQFKDRAKQKLPQMPMDTLNFFQILQIKRQQTECPRKCKASIESMPS